VVSQVAKSSPSLVGRDPLNARKINWSSEPWVPIEFLTDHRSLADPVYLAVLPATKSTRRLCAGGESSPVQTCTWHGRGRNLETDVTRRAPNPRSPAVPDRQLTAKAPPGARPPWVAESDARHGGRGGEEAPGRRQADRYEMLLCPPVGWPGSLASAWTWVERRGRDPGARLACSTAPPPPPRYPPARGANQTTRAAAAAAVRRAEWQKGCAAGSPGGIC
jgi:hypothetical protein